MPEDEFRVHVKQCTNGRHVVGSYRTVPPFVWMKLLCGQDAHVGMCETPQQNTHLWQDGLADHGWSDDTPDIKRFAS